MSARTTRSTLRSLLLEAKRSELNDTFQAYWRQLAQGLPEPAAEYMPIQGRKWRIDFAWPDARIAVELDGGGYGQIITCSSCGAAVRARKADGSPGAVLRMPYPSHFNEDGHNRDNEKSNALTLAGWLVLRFSSRQLAEDPYAVIGAVMQLLLQRMGGAAA